jgi:hypothetical protein
MLPPLPIVAALLLVGALSSGCVSPPQRGDIDARLGSLAARALNRDFRIEFYLERGVTICGGTGDYFVGAVEMNKRVRVIDETGRVQLSDNWIKIDKSYAVGANELSAPYLPLMANDTCLE